MRKLTRKSLDDLAKTLPVIEESVQMNYVGGGDGTSADPYSQAQFYNMLDNGQWNGGFVDGMGYVANEAYAYGSSHYPGQTSQDYYTFPDYVTSLSTSGVDFLINQFWGSVPFAGSFTENYTRVVDNMTRDIQAELLNRGYTGSSSFYIVTTPIMGTSMRFSVFDARNGELITSRIVDKSGYHK